MPITPPHAAAGDGWHPMDFPWPYVIIDFSGVYLYIYIYTCTYIHWMGGAKAIDVIEQSRPPKVNVTLERGDLKVYFVVFPSLIQ